LHVLSEDKPCAPPSILALKVESQGQISPKFNYF